MKKKSGQKFSSLRYSMQKTSSRIANFHPSRYFLAAMVMGASIFLLGGGIYDILLQPLAALTISSRYIFFYPLYLHEQLLNESVGVMILYTMGALGLFLIYQSFKYVRNPRQFSLVFRISLALFVLAFVAIEVLLYWKLNFSTG